MKLLRPFLCTLCFAACLYVKAQQPQLNFKRITSKDGLAGDIVYCLLQDKQGFLWIGTHRGLDRYDGYHFIHYNYDPSDTNSISGNHVHCIKEDRDGILWLTTNNGLNSLDPLTGKIIRYKHQDSTLPSYMEDIFVVNDSIFLINTTTAIYRFNKKTTDFVPIKIQETQYPFTTDIGVKFTKDNKGRIFIGSLMINWKQATAVYLSLTDIANIPNSLVNQIYFDSQNNAWCFALKDALLTKQVSGNKISYPYSANNVTALENVIRGFYEETGKRLWICSGAGLVLYDYVQNNFYRYRQQNNNDESLSNNRTNCLIKDRNGAYWVGTFGGGLCYFTLKSRFKHIIIDTTSNAEDRIVYGLKTLHSGRILVSTMAQKHFIIEKDKNIHEWKSSKDSISFDSIVLETTGRSLRAFPRIPMRKAFPQNNFYLLGAYFHVNLQTLSAPVTNIIKPFVDPLIIDKNNKVWAFLGNIQLVNTDTFMVFKQTMKFPAITPDNNFLFVTKTGLLLFDTRTYAIKATYSPQKNNPYSLGSTFINYLLPDTKGNFWIATGDAGMDFWDTKTDRFYHYTTKNGLPDNTVYMLLPDKHGRLWISTNNGLSCFDTASKTFTNYNKSDGLINTEFNSGSACIDKEGYMYFGGMNGIDYFHPDSLTEIKRPPSLYVSAFKIYDELKSIASFYKLATNDNNITIEFTANDLLNASKIFYRHKLKAVDNTWMMYKGRNTAMYNKLPPGKYDFQVQASYDSKNWGKPLVIDFSIATPWFKAWWFYTLLLLFAAFALQWLFRYRLQQKLKILHVRNRIHRDLHDDVGATLSSVKAYSEILKDDPGNPVIVELIEENATEMIERLEVIAWAANPRHDSFGSLIDKINRYAAPVCIAKHMQLNISTDGISKDTLMPGEVRQNIFLVAKEAINNAVKYSDAENCSINSFISGGKFMMEIRDDGNGFDGMVNSSGNGLQNMDERIKEIGGEIVITSGKGKGAKIQIQLAYPFRTPASFSLKNNHR